MRQKYSSLGLLTNFKKSVKTVLLLVFLFIPFVSVLMNVSLTQALSISSVRDCNANAVIHCGALSTAELQDKCSHDATIQVIFDDFGILSCNIGSMGTIMSGQVTSSGQVFAGGKMVATNAITAGRQDIAGSQAVTKNGVTFFVRPPSVSFVSSPLAAFVVMSGNQFKFAVLASCGNPVKASTITKTVVKKSKPVQKVTVVKVVPKTPVQSQSQQQSQSQSIVIEQTPAATTTASQTQTMPAAQPAAASTPAPQQLPNTGMGDVLGLGAFVSLISAAAHYIYKSYKLKVVTGPDNH